MNDLNENDKPNGSMTLTDEDRKILSEKGFAADLIEDLAAIRQKTEEAKADRDKPAHESLNDLLEDIVKHMKRFVTFTSEEQADAIALWIVHTYVIDQCYFTPYLHIFSAVKRSGKSRLAEVVGALCHRPITLSDPTGPTLFRIIAERKPTLTVEEVDTLFTKKSEEFQAIRSVLNSGFQRGIPVYRTVGHKHTITEFDPFGPKIIVGIRQTVVPDTIRDRSIPIHMERAAKGSMAKYRPRKVQGTVDTIRASILHFTEEMDIEGADPEMPEDLNDRAQDIWEPLFAIADHAGATWGDRARKAALALSAEVDASEQELGIKLLSDIREIFFTSHAQALRLHSEVIHKSLIDMKESPWDDLNFSVSKVSRKLKDFNIKSKSIRVGMENKKGFEREQFEDVWARLLPPRTEGE